MMYALLAVAAVIIVAQLGVILLLVRQHEETVDRLTSKIMAPDLNSYTLNRKSEQMPIVQRRGPKPVGVGLAGPREEIIPLSDANPEEVMQALERQGGYEEE